MSEPLPVYPNLLDRDDLRVLVYGDGGRVHALAEQLQLSPLVSEVLVGIGSGGSDEINVPSIKDVPTAVRFAVQHEIDLVLPATDQALADGMVDQLAMRGTAAFGPARKAAKIEWWKPYGKRLMREAGIPTTDFRVFRSPNTAHRYLDKKGAGVLKAAGLTRAKGVLVCLEDLDEGHQFIDDVLGPKRLFGDAGREMVIEDPADGEEFSMHAITDGITAKPFISSQDYKQAYDGDKGPNTGGIGTTAPVLWLPQPKINDLSEIYIDPMLSALWDKGIHYRGIIYPGIKGRHKLEDNARFGDPETQVYMRLLKTDLAELVVMTLNNRLDEVDLEWKDQHAICVTLCSTGYPDTYDIGKKIDGLETAIEIEGIKIYHAGTVKEDDDFYTSGGRVLHVTATGQTPEEARNRAYEAAGRITFDGSQDNVHMRTDIGKRPVPITF